MKWKPQNMKSNGWTMDTVGYIPNASWHAFVSRRLITYVYPLLPW
jgi:hypothetical protein